ncbi:Uncharacterized protein FWK35_00031711 [Aphis craccivora]|uniref:Uncharacterized protein n=1 Tax=Aphis craccivora TaxID=307492 RepID=A0A6G0VKC6_APHCR|nr:Uncharacterized protein FWK35_00031711 [Aphis craccivora]
MIGFLTNVRQRIKIKLVSSEKCLQKLINKSTFKHCTTYNKNVLRYLLEISKTLMYEYHYDVMQKHYDSLVYHIITDDQWRRTRGTGRVVARPIFWGGGWWMVDDQ